MPLLLFGIESWHVAVFIAVFGIIVIFILVLFDPASPRCRECNEYVGLEYCLFCRGSCVREFVDGDRIVEAECKHHDWLISGCLSQLPLIGGEYTVYSHLRLFLEHPFPVC